MYCPKCKAEYMPGHTKCADCNEELVEELPQQSEVEYVDYKELLSTNSPNDVALIKSILDEADIAYYLQGEYSAPYVYHAIPIRLLVREDQADRAVEILKEFNFSFTFGGLHRLSERDEEI